MWVKAYGTVRFIKIYSRHNPFGYFKISILSVNILVKLFKKNSHYAFWNNSTFICLVNLKEKNMYK